MNIGLYSFNTIEVKQVEKLKNDIIQGFLCVDNIYLYSENTTKQRIQCRQAFRKIIEDYKNKKIDWIVFEDYNTMSQDYYTRGLMLKELLENKCNFEFLKENINSQSNKIITELQIHMSNYLKESNDERSRRGNKIAKMLKDEKV